MNRLLHLGQYYGEIIQLHDDINDAMAVPAAPDWTNPSTSLPILFAMRVNHPDHIRFQTLRQNSHTLDALQEAQAILIRCGAISYAVDQLLQKYRVAKKLLGETPLTYREHLEALLAEVLDPVMRVYETITPLSERTTLLQWVG